MELRIRSVDERLLKQLDILAKQKKFRNRNELVLDILKKYCSAGDTFFTQNLPDTVRFALRETVQEEKEKESAMLSAVLDIQKETVQTLRELIAVFGLDSSETANF